MPRRNRIKQEGHTYDKWQELGYQVIRGETASYTYYGNKIFTRDQVVKIKKSYRNHCWNCGESINSRINSKCYECEMYECDNCGCCMCDYD